MEQAESKECPKAEAGEFHDSHSWLDKEGLHACPGLEDMTAEEVMARMGLHRRVETAMDEVQVANLLYGDGQNGLPPAESIKKLFAEGRIDEKLYDDPLNDVRYVPFPPLSDEFKGYSPNDPLYKMQQTLADSLDIPVDHLIGPRTEFAVRTYGWTEKQLRDELYKKEQEVLELKEQMFKVGEKVTRIMNKMLRRAGE